MYELGFRILERGVKAVLPVVIEVVADFIFNDSIKK